MRALTAGELCRAGVDSAPRALEDAHPMWKRRSLVVLVLVALAGPMTSCTCSEPPAAVPDAGSSTLTVQSFRLANGMEVELVSGPCGDEAAIAVLFGGGRDHDPPGRSGMAEVVGRILASSGGENRVVEIGADHTLDAIVVPSDRLLEEIDRAAARIATAELGDDAVATARAAVLADVAARHGGDPSLTARSYAAESVQPTRGNGWRGGVAAEVEAIDRAQVEAHRRAQLHPGAARLVVAGRFDASAVRARIERAFASLPAGTPPVAREPADSTVTGTLVMGDAPSVVALAVPAPPPADPLYAPFLVLASRLLGSTSQGESWDATYDPIAQPETLLVVGAVRPGEQAEPAAARIRAEVSAILARPLAPADVDAARERFGSFLGVDELEPARCDDDPRALAVARARRAQLGLDAAALREALEGTTPEQVAASVTRFEPTRTAAVIAGGAIR